MTVIVERPPTGGTVVVQPADKPGGVTVSDPRPNVIALANGAPVPEDTQPGTLIVRYNTTP